MYNQIHYKDKNYKQSKPAIDFSPKNKAPLTLQSGGLLLSGFNAD